MGEGKSDTGGRHASVDYAGITGVQMESISSIHTKGVIGLFGVGRSNG